jgi:signal transduction histidine kinase
MVKFRTKARAVELLGKGQIADLPTAITELWKNGYDAYADNLEAHLFCEGFKGLNKSLFVISDDGTGMDKDDLLNKWMVIGTDTKIKAIKDKKGEDTLGKEPRIKTGEKGIGRLSVSFLGTQMLLLTKKRNSPLFSLFFDWRILDNFNLYLEDIQIPFLQIEDSDNFYLIFDKLKKDFMQNLESQDSRQWEEYEDLYDVLIKDNKKLKLPSFFNEEFIENFGPKKRDKHGTKFIIFNPIDQISELMDADKPDDIIPEGVFYNSSSLSGLANHFIKNKKVFKTKFNVYKSEIPIDIVQQREFFTYEDFDNCDHLIEGKFDENAYFKGAVRIYKKIIDHEFKPNRPPGKSTYGPFQIKLGYIPGKTDSMLPGDQFDKYNKMLNRYGGFYIYRDGFRVLPYGRSDQDFLAFEERRTRGIGYYFFGYRRMFGYIAITRMFNPNLRDKAGREGFVSNKAYREFQEDLKKFFIDLAAKYFRTSAEFTYKDDQLKEIKEEKLEKEREQAERKEFNKNIKEHPIRLNKYSSQLDTLLDELEILVGKSKVVYDKIEALLVKIDKLRSDLRKISPPSPKRFRPTDNQRKKLFKYSSNYQKTFDLIEKRYQKSYSEAKEKLKGKELLEEFNRKIKNYNQEFKKIRGDFDQRIKRIASDFVSEIETLNEDFLFQFDSKAKKLTPNKLSRPDLEHSLELLDKMYLELRNDFEEKLNPFIEHLERLNIDIDEDKLVGYYKIQYEEIKDLWQQTQELAQLGIAVEIIDHQFNALYSQLANIIGMFKNSIKDDKKSKRLYAILVSTFEHLQNNYKFLTPLYRTTGRTRKDISGKEIKEYIEAFYSERFQNDNIQLSSTKRFDNSTVYTYESIIKPVFINIVNNAVYWLASADKRMIRLDFEEDKYMIMNSGQPIDEIYIKEDIFKLFFSRKPKGRGIGLYLAKTTLNSVGFDIEATNNPKYNRLNGACIIIRKVK